MVYHPHDGKAANEIFKRLHQFVNKSREPGAMCRPHENDAREAHGKQHDHEAAIGKGLKRTVQVFMLCRLV